MGVRGVFKVGIAGSEGSVSTLPPLGRRETVEQKLGRDHRALGWSRQRASVNIADDAAIRSSRARTSLHEERVYFADQQVCQQRNPIKDGCGSLIGPGTTDSVVIDRQNMYYMAGKWKLTGDGELAPCFWHVSKGC